MPYIPKDERVKYDGLIDCLANMINSDVHSGELFQVLIRIFRRFATSLCDPVCNGKRCYARMAVVLSAMNECNHEFRRRVFCPDNKLRCSVESFRTHRHESVHYQLVDSLTAILNRLPDNDTLSGELNYVLFRLAKRLFQCAGKPVADIVTCAMFYEQNNFRLKVLVPYEEGKIRLAGDVE
jgi:hypothetical protein